MAVLWLYQKEHKNLIAIQQDELSNKKQLIVELLKPMIANLYYWEQYSFSESDFDPENNAHLDKKIGDFVIGMDSYSQFRLIDLSGNEVYRLNRQENGKIVKSTSLQDKGERDYYKSTTDLKKSQIYLSPLNLNQENGILELPYKPMIRGVTPIFDKQGTKLGIVVINFSAEKLLDLLKKDNHYSFILLDRSGNYLVSKDSVKEFAHLIPNSQNITFYEEHPGLGDSLRSKESTSSFKSGDLWIKTELDFINELSQTPLFQHRFADIKTNNKWVLLKHIESQVLNARLKSEIVTILLINLLAIMVILCLSYLEARSDASKKKYMQALEVMNRKLESKSTELENKNNALAIIQNKLELRNAQLLDYNNIVAHNLRAPTTSVSALVSMLGEAEDYEQAKSYFPKLQKVTHAINTLVDDLLVYVRILNDDDLVGMENIAMEPLIEASLDLYVETLDKETIEVRTDFSAWNEIKFSRIYLQSVIQNLVSNAIKYRDVSKKPVINIRTLWENDKKVLIVEDNGIGVDLDRYGSDIFKLYKRFHRGLSGKGMGLFLVKTQLESLNANIEVASVLGQGTTFKITFDNYE
ncbi:sensor histidine kinase [Arenibacter sp. F20364]|uniref:sensor histidine kinase n=1 Tax=Arenibacter sp. F20364 TaxID=2926415 RepID=UPI001FF6AC74|nr:sensor histidine kinase [Arenibacter sp. F20364]MCK0192533.1 sensor histidine kinase [Arenibacter sp. F20364]